MNLPNASLHSATGRGRGRRACLPHWYNWERFKWLLVNSPEIDNTNGNIIYANISSTKNCLDDNNSHFARTIIQTTTAKRHNDFDTFAKCNTPEKKVLHYSDILKVLLTNYDSLITSGVKDNFNYKTHPFEHNVSWNKNDFVMKNILQQISECYDTLLYYDSLIRIRPLFLSSEEKQINDIATRAKQILHSKTIVNTTTPLVVYDNIYLAEVAITQQTGHQHIHQQHEHDIFSDADQDPSNLHNTTNASNHCDKPLKSNTTCATLQNKRALLLQKQISQHSLTIQQCELLCTEEAKKIENLRLQFETAKNETEHLLAQHKQCCRHITKLEVTHRILGEMLADKVSLLAKKRKQLHDRNIILKKKIE